MIDSTPFAAVPPAPVATERQPLLRVIADALRGVETDLTEAPLGRALVMLAVPWGHVWRTYVAAPGDRWR